MTAPNHPPLTRFMLDRALVVHQQYWRAATDEEQEAHMEEWHDFMCVYGLETIALALAALGRLEPRYHVRPKSYQKHTLGPAQQKIVDTLSEMGPKRATELAALTGIHERNLRRNLVSMRARGMLTLDGRLWGLPEWEAATPTETTNAAEVATTLPICKPVVESVNQAPEPAVTSESAKPEPASQLAEVVPILPNPSESDEQPLRLGELPRLENESAVEAWARRYLERREEDEQPAPPPTDPTA